MQQITTSFGIRRSTLVRLFFIVFCGLMTEILSITVAFANLPVPPSPSSSPQSPPAAVKQILPTEISELIEKKNYKQAEGALEKLYVSNRNPSVLFYLGKVAFALGRQVSAADLYRRYIEILGDQADPELRSHAERFLKNFDSHVSELSVNGPVGRFLYVDDHPIGELPLPNSMLIGPEPHVFRLVSGSLRSTSEPLSIPADRRTTVTLTGSGSSLSTLLSLSQGILLRVNSGNAALPLDPIYRGISKSVESQNGVLISRERQDSFVKQQPGLSRCLLSSECQEPLVKAGELSFVLELTIRQELDRTDRTQLSMRLFDIHTASYSSVRSEDCAISDVPQRTADLASKLVEEAISRGRGSLSVAASPAGATVAVDDLHVGTTPYRRDSFVGSHHVSIAAPGYSEHAATVAVDAGRETPLNVTLVKLPGTEFAGRPLWRAALGGGLLSAGLIVGGFGVAALAIDGRCTNDLRTDDYYCNYFDTSRTGLALTIPGAAVAAAGGILFAWPRR